MAIGPLPNIADGHITAGTRSVNLWRTGIESALLWGGGTSYLATECRAEHVGEGPLTSPRYCEVSAISAPDGDLIIRAGAGIWHPFRRQLSEDLHYTPYGGGTAVHAPPAPVKQIGLDELRDTLVADTPTRLFLQVNYVFEGESYRLLCPARYINFPADGTTPYIQPISGYVLFRRGGRYQIGYVVAYLPSAGASRCEVVLREKRSVVSLKRGIGGLAVRLLDVLTKSFGWALETDEFAEIVTLDRADVTFFTYE